MTRWQLAVQTNHAEEVDAQGEEAIAFLLGFLDRGNVKGHALQEQQLALRITHHVGRAVNPDDPAVLAQEAIDRLEGRAGGAGGGKVLVPAFAVIGVELPIPEDGIFQPFFLGEAEQLFDLRADVQFRDALVQGSDEGHRRDVLHQRPELGLLPLALTDVADDSGGENALLGADWAEADLDGKLAAVPASAVQFQAHSHGTHTRLGEEALSVADVSKPESLGHQGLDGLTQQVLFAITEQSFGLAIEQDNQSLGINHDDGVGQALDHFMQGPLRPEGAGQAERSLALGFRGHVRASRFHRTGRGRSGRIRVRGTGTGQAFQSFLGLQVVRVCCPVLLVHGQPLLENGACSPRTRIGGPPFGGQPTPPGMGLQASRKPTQVAFSLCTGNCSGGQPFRGWPAWKGSAATGKGKRLAAGGSASNMPGAPRRLVGRVVA